MLEDACRREPAGRRALCSGARIPPPSARSYPVWTEAAHDASLRALEESATSKAMIGIGLRDAKESVDLMAYLAATRDGLGRE
jgi:hypothetical protein